MKQLSHTPWWTVAGGLFLVLLQACSPEPEPHDLTVIRFDRTGAFERVVVVDQWPHRYLRFGDANGDSQSMIDLEDPQAVPTPYVRLATHGAEIVERLDKVLMIGLGAGTFTTFLYHKYPEVQIDAVEIDPLVVEVAREFFDLPQSERYRVHVADGAAFIEASDQTYDLIMLDAYGAGGVPEALATEAFFASVYDHLAPGGLVISNVSTYPDERAMLVERQSRVFDPIGCAWTEDHFSLLILGSRSPRTYPEWVGPCETAETGPLSSGGA